MFRHDPFASVIPPFHEAVFREVSYNYYPQIQELARWVLYEDARNVRVPESPVHQWTNSVQAADRSTQRAVHAICGSYYVKARALHKQAHLKMMEDLLKK